MSASNWLFSDSIYQFMLQTTVQEHPVLAELREITATHPMAEMQIPPEQGQLMQLLVKLIKAERTLEVGTFTGYSALAVALALPEDGLLISCDVSEEWTAIGKPYWEKAGVADKIDLRISPAAQTLTTLLAEDQGNSFDFAFIDADKASYPQYYELCLQLLRPGGLVAIDNVLWDGKVADPEISDNQTKVLREMNEIVGSDSRVDCSLVPIADGLLLARKQ